MEVPFKQYRGPQGDGLARKRIASKIGSASRTNATDNPTDAPKRRAGLAHRSAPEPRGARAPRPARAPASAARPPSPEPRPAAATARAPRAAGVLRAPAVGAQL